MTVNISNETKIRLDVDYKETAEITAAEVLRTEGIRRGCEVSVLLVNNSQIREINREQRAIDSATDVLSFPMIDFEKPGKLPRALKEYKDPATGLVLLGDIVISLEKVRSQARKYGHSERREFAFLIAHSMLHLLGYDHVGSGEEEKVMFEKQERVLRNLGITRETEGMRTAETVRKGFSEKKRIVVKIGSSSLAHKESGELDLVKTEKLVRELTDLRNRGKDVILVSSGAVMVGKNTIGERGGSDDINFKQACASVGQAKLMMIYQKLFSEYNQLCSQVLLTQENIIDDAGRNNARNTFEELLRLGVIPIVNENDTVATRELDQLSVLGDNDTLSAIVAAVTEADLLIMLSDIDGLYTDDPNRSSDAGFIEIVEEIEKVVRMAKGPSSSVGTGGMSTKINAALITTSCGADMVIASGHDFSNIHRIVNGKKLGTIFPAGKKDGTLLIKYLKSEDIYGSES